MKVFGLWTFRARLESAHHQCWNSEIHEKIGSFYILSFFSFTLFFTLMLMRTCCCAWLNSKAEILGAVQCLSLQQQEARSTWATLLRRAISTTQTTVLTEAVYEPLPTSNNPCGISVVWTIFVPPVMPTTILSLSRRKVYPLVIVSYWMYGSSKKRQWSDMDGGCSKLISIHRNWSALSTHMPIMYVAYDIMSYLSPPFELDFPASCSSDSTDPPRPNQTRSGQPLNDEHNATNGLQL